MPSLKVLIVEDSLMVQEILKKILSSDPEIEVVDVAGNGQEGAQKAANRILCNGLCLWIVILLK